MPAPDARPFAQNVLDHLRDADWWFDTPEDIQQQWLVDRLEEIINVWG